MSSNTRVDSNRTAEAHAEAIHLRKRRNHQRALGWRV